MARRQLFVLDEGSSPRPQQLLSVRDPGPPAQHAWPLGILPLSVPHPPGHQQAVSLGLWPVRASTRTPVPCACCVLSVGSSVAGVTRVPAGLRLRFQRCLDTEGEVGTAFPEDVTDAMALVLACVSRRV